MSLTLPRIARLAAAALAFAALPASSFIIGPQPDPDAIIVEEYLHDLGDGRSHYFLAADTGEKRFIEAGGAGPGWRATGHRFGAFRAGSNRAPGKVCRFYAPGPVTHFFTASTPSIRPRTGDTDDCYFCVLVSPWLLTSTVCVVPPPIESTRQVRLPTVRSSAPTCCTVKHGPPRRTFLRTTPHSSPRLRPPRSLRAPVPSCG